MAEQRMISCHRLRSGVRLGSEKKQWKKKDLPVAHIEIAVFPDQIRVRFDVNSGASLVEASQLVARASPLRSFHYLKK